MAFSKFIGSGYIMSVNKGEVNGTSTLNVSVSVPTGEEKKDGEQYNPSNVVKFTLWGKRADALENVLEKGQKIVFDGNMGRPYIYEKEEDGLVATLQLTQLNQLEILPKAERKEENEQEAAPATKAKSSSKKNTKKPVEVLDDEFDLDEDEFDL